MKAALVEVIQSYIEELENRFISSDDVEAKIAALSALVGLLESYDTLSEVPLDSLNDLQKYYPAAQEGYTGALFLVVIDEVIQSTNKPSGNDLTDDWAIDILKDLNVLYITLCAEIKHMDDSDLSGFGRGLIFAICDNLNLKKMKRNALRELRGLLETGVAINIGEVNAVKEDLRHVTTIEVEGDVITVPCLEFGRSGVIYNRVHDFVVRRSFELREGKDIEVYEMESNSGLTLNCEG